MKDVEVFGKTPRLNSDKPQLTRRAIDWTKVSWIAETGDGLANLIMHHENPKATSADWCVVDVPFDEAVTRWTKWKKTGVDYDPTQKRRWWRCW